jgi:hypothetical protein
LAQDVNSRIQAAIETHVQIGPEMPRKLSAGHEFTRISKQQFEHLKWFLLQLYVETTLSQLPIPQVEFECSETKPTSGADGRGERITQWTIAVRNCHTNPKPWSAR